MENLEEHHKKIHKQIFENVLRVPIKHSIKERLPWLIIGLTGGLLAASIVKGFEETLSANLLLAGFIPLIVYMSDAVGVQMETFVIRDTAIRRHFNFKKYVTRQFIIVFFMAIILSSFLFLATLLFMSSTITISSILALALFLSILSSVLTGLLLPFLFERLRLDPANASGPIATIIQDLLSITIYLVIAQTLLS